MALRRVLALRALGLGDLLTAVPALRALEKALPDAERVLATPQVLAPLVELAGLRYHVLHTAALAPIPWHGRPPDVAVNLHGSGPQSHGLLQRLAPRRLVAFARDEVEGPAWRADEHERARWCRLVEESFGVPADPSDLRFPHRPGTGRGPAVVHPGAASGSRRWPPERFAAVARRLALEGHRVLVTGGAEERQLALRVARTAGLPASCVAAGRTTLSQLAQLVARAAVVVCGDTGMAHLASAFCTPSVVLFGPVSPAAWGPPADGPHLVLWHGDGTGDPHADAPDPALLRITPDEVIAAVSRLDRPARAPSAAS